MNNNTRLQILKSVIFPLALSLLCCKAILAADPVIQPTEQYFLEQLQSAQSDAKKAQIYVDLASMFHSKSATNAAKIVQYSEQALRLPLPPLTKCELYLFETEAYGTALSRASGERAAQLRFQSAESCLKGLAVILQKTTSDVVEENLPALGKYSADGPIAKVLEERHAKQLADRNAVIENNSLIEYRWKFIDACASFYRGHPDQLEKLESLAKRLLPKNPDVVAQLIQRVKAKEPLPPLDSRIRAAIARFKQSR